MKLNAAAAAFLIALVSAVFGVSSIAADPSEDLDRATRPLVDGVPEVAVVRLRELLGKPLTYEDRRAATAKLGEALTAAGQPEEALVVLNEPALRDPSPTKFLRAQAFAALGRWAEALPLYQQAAFDREFPLRAAALYGQADALRALGRFDEAMTALRLLERDRRWTTRARLRAVELLIEKQDIDGARRLLQSVQTTVVTERKERRLLAARIEAATNPDHAAEMFQSILKNPEGAPRAVVNAALFGNAEVNLQSGTPEAGDDALEEFIERHPGDPDLPAVFAKLDQLYAAERQQSRHDLGRWSLDPAQPRQALAQWYLARASLRLKRRDLARAAFAQLRASHPALPVLAEAYLEDARLAGEDGLYDEALQILKSARELRPEPALLAQVEMAIGENEYRAQHFDVAAQTFQRLAQAQPAHARDALYDATLAWVEAGKLDAAAAQADELKSSGATEETRGDLQLEQALIAAAHGDAKATEMLQKFLRDFPKHPRASDAWVTLAELAFHAAPPRLDEARQHLAHAAEGQPTPSASERADYLAIWLQDAATPTDDTKVITLATEFIDKHAASAFLPDVRLKLAETYFRRQDFASAQTQFELLAQRNAASPLAEKARFFAAQSAMQTMSANSLDHALKLFDEVVKAGGELKWAARNEQAAAERRLGNPQDALTLYDEVLRGEASPVEKREALCAKGDILYELGTADAENYRRALALYDQLAAQPDVPAHWRNQALFKKGTCLEKLNEPAEALATLYRVIDDESRPGKRTEFFWYYKAGFNAARLLEQQAKWQPAAAVYEKLAFAGGGRSEEAKSRLNRLRLEHFLWDQ